jgi:predicted  nucleic acid-binding Zn-ribbon protein
MNEKIALICNAIVMMASIAVGLKYYLACQELHAAVKSASERDGSQYANSFQALLWQEKKNELEKHLAAHKKAIENLTEQMVALKERYAGLEISYHEARHDLDASITSRVQAEAGKRKRKNG